VDLGGVEIPSDEALLTQTEMSFSWNALGAQFAGPRDGNKVTGTFKQGPLDIPFELNFEGSDAADVHIQTWQGNMKAGPQEFEFQFRVFEDSDQNVTVKLDSIGERVGGIACEMTHEGDTVTIDIPATQAQFVGTLNAAMDTCEGTWKQRGNEIPLTIRNVDVSLTRDWNAVRPQTPRPPYNYEVIHLKIDNDAADGVTLAGTLTAPRGTGPFPTVILISGSGPQDRDETIFEHKPFRVIADHLAKNGVACFRYDDRGIAESTGNFGEATSADFATDVSAIVDYLKTQPLIDAERICLMGHSEGGIIAPMVASGRSDIAAVVMLAGTGVDGRQISLNQGELIARASGAPQEMIDLQNTLLSQLFARQDAGDEFDDEFLSGLTGQITSALPAEMRDSIDVEPIVRDAAMKLDSKWFEFFGTYDPAPALREVKCPVYAVFGEKDLQVDPQLNVPAIDAALRTGGNTDFTLEVLPGLNHLFQECETGSIIEYNQIDQTFQPEALEKITAWVVDRLK
ncbi:MAG: alpha/beta fold hydrolase, partial [Planctomycetota bacterium]